MLSPMMLSPMNRIPKPKITSPIFLIPCLLQNMTITTPIMTINGAMSDRLNAMSCPVIVVPIFAPKITPDACIRFISPEFTKLTTITVVALEDWMIAVNTIPTIIPINRFLVKNSSMLRIFAPAAFSSPSLIIFIPYRKNPSPPSSIKIVVILIRILLYSTFAKKCFPYSISLSMHAFSSATLPNTRSGLRNARRSMATSFP